MEFKRRKKKVETKLFKGSLGWAFPFQKSMSSQKQLRKASQQFGGITEPPKNVGRSKLLHSFSADNQHICSD